MRRRGLTFIEVVVVLGVIVILAAILFPLFARGGHDSPRASCLVNLKQVGLGFSQYIQDYDERFPPISISAVASSTQAGSNPYGWADALQTYIRGTAIYHCPTLKKQTDHTKKNRQNDAVLSYYTDYYYNTNLDRVLLEKVPNPAMLVLCGEGNDGTDGTDARYNRNVIPQVWIDTENSPARRHLDTANYLFADGHVKAFKSAMIKSTRNSANDYSFSARQ
jgi:prepilin-type processing-associated H-X9-DG protein/prepilin-type N-terminal cleavage/methylation domain-containing protein